MYGIVYALKFNGTDKVYIGQTIDVSRRKSSHINLMKTGNHVAKLQEAYAKYGTPDFHILIEAESPDELDALELEAINVYDSVDNGFNTKAYIASRHVSSYGDLNGNSKYSNAEIIELVRFVLSNKTMTIRKVAEIFNIPKVVVEEIVGGVKHKWLARAIPEEYTELLSMIGTRSKALTAIDRGIIYPPIISPEGVEHIVTHLRGFAREHNLNNTSLSNVLRGKQLQHKGWKLKTELPLTN